MYAKDIPAPLHSVPSGMKAQLTDDRVFLYVDKDEKSVMEVIVNAQQYNRARGAGRYYAICQESVLNVLLGLQEREDLTSVLTAGQLPPPYVAFHYTLTGDWSDSTIEIEIRRECRLGTVHYYRCQAKLLLDEDPEGHPTTTYFGADPSLFVDQLRGWCGMHIGPVRDVIPVGPRLEPKK